VFEVPTVLVLGAGASWHYGYPLGEELIDKIIFQTADPDSHSESTRLGKSLKFHDPISIDSFLNFRRSDERLVNAGKYEITNAILDCENKEHFDRNHSNKGNWYKFIVNALLSNIRDPQELLTLPLNLTVITFNYDLSLEYYLYSRFKSIPTLSEQQIQQFLNKLNDSIIHFYGQVGKFKWQGDTGGRDNEDYGIFQSRRFIGDDGLWNRDQYIKPLYEQIRLIGDRSLEKDKANQKLVEAERIYFLGFGFNSDNVAELELVNTCRSAKHIYFTNFGGSQIIEKVADTKLFSWLHKKDDDVYHPQLPRHGTEHLVSSSKDVYNACKYDFILN
jgi:hypothetical protein